MTRALRLPVLLFAWLAAAQSQRPDNQPFPPYRVIGNVYYHPEKDYLDLLARERAGR